MIIDSKFGLGFILGFLSYHSYNYFLEKCKKNDIFIKQDEVNKILELTKFTVDEDNENVDNSDNETSEDIILDEEIYNQLTSEEDELYEIKIIVNEIINKIIEN
jgi:hypothetical protein